MLFDTNDLLNVKCPVSKGARYLAQSYLAEALLYSDKLNESIENLTANARLENDADISFLSQSSSEGVTELDDIEHLRLNQTEWYPKDANNARAIAFFNLSVAHAIRGEVDVAYKHFKTVRTLLVN